MKKGLSACEKRVLLCLWITAVIGLAAALWIFASCSPVIVSFLDVGQGDACLLRAETGEAVLIDGGDSGEGETLMGYFAVKNIDALDAVFVSHFHEDHSSGIAEILEAGFPVACIYTPYLESGTEAEKRVLNAAERAGADVRRVSAGDQIQLGGIEYHVLWPDKDSEVLDLNNMSMVLRTVYDGTTLLFTGDIEKTTADMLAERYGEKLYSDVLKVPHHGSSSSVSPALMEACRPLWAVISAGTGNQYGDPSDSMLRSLLEKKTGIWRTDRDGTVEMTLGRDAVKNVRRAEDKWRND